MVRVVGNEGALGAMGGGNCRSGMDGSKTIMRRHPGRGSVCCSGGFRDWVGRLSKRERGKKIKNKIKGGGVEEGEYEMELRHGWLEEYIYLYVLPDS